MNRVLLLTLCLTTGCLEKCLETKVVRYDGGVCASDADCATEGLYCDVPTSTCVACATNTHCGSDDTTPTCDDSSKTCRACASSADCDGALGGSLCDLDSGRCIECVDDTTCGSGTCDLTTNACTAVPPGTVARCHPCVSQTQCFTGDACVRDEFAGQPLDFVCMPRPIMEGCSAAHPGQLRPFARPRTAPSISGAETVAVCAPGIDTTCAALIEVGVSCSTDDDCGASGLSDGYCTTVEGTSLRCSVPCAETHQCPTGRACATNPPNDPLNRCR